MRMRAGSKAKCSHFLLTLIKHKLGRSPVFLFSSVPLKLYLLAELSVWSTTSKKPKGNETVLLSESPVGTDTIPAGRAGMPAEAVGRCGGRSENRRACVGALESLWVAKTEPRHKPCKITVALATEVLISQFSRTLVGVAHGSHSHNSVNNVAPPSGSAISRCVNLLRARNGLIGL